MYVLVTFCLLLSSLSFRFNISFTFLLCIVTTVVYRHHQSCSYKHKKFKLRKSENGSFNINFCYTSVKIMANGRLILKGILEWKNFFIVFLIPFLLLPIAASVDESDPDYKVRYIQIYRYSSQQYVYE